MNITMLGSGSYQSSLSTRLVSFGKYLALEGHDVTIILPGADKYNNFVADINARIPEVHLIQPWQCSTRSATLNLLPYLLTSFVALLRSRPDVVYVYKPTPITIIGLVFRLIPGKRAVLDLDDLGSEVMHLQGQSAVQVKLVAWCERLAIRVSSAIVVASTYLKTIVQSQVPTKRLLVLSNGVEPDEYYPNEKLALRSVVLYYGAINRLNLVEDLLRAWPAVMSAKPTAELHIIGDGTALHEAKQLSQKLGIAKSVVFTGWISNQDLGKHAQFGDIGVCYQPDTPTVRAASNLKVFQYMALGAVPVVSDVGDLKHYVQDGKAGVAVAMNQPDKLADALIDLLHDEHKRIKLATAARQLAVRTYSWRRLTERLAEFIA